MAEDAGKGLTFEEANKMEKELGHHDVVDSAFKLENPENLCWMCSRFTSCYAALFTYGDIIVGCNYFQERTEEEKEQ